MKSFRKFIEEENNTTNVAKSYTPSFIHFKHVQITENKNVETPAAIHFKHIPEKIKEDTTNSQHNFYNWYNKNDNNHLGEHSDDISDELHRDNKFNLNHQKAIKAYTSYNTSYDRNDENAKKEDWYCHKINSALIQGKSVSRKFFPSETQKALQKTVDGLDSAIKSNPLKTKLDTYSGVSFDPKKYFDENGIMNSPAYISATHNKDIATRFATNASKKIKNSDGSMHIMHFHLKPGDPAIHVSHVSPFYKEHETVIGRGVKLKHLGTDSYMHPEKNINIHVHHVEIVKD